jgi:hypothetical protein
MKKGLKTGLRLSRLCIGDYPGFAAKTRQKMKAGQSG